MLQQGLEIAILGIVAVFTGLGVITLLIAGIGYWARYRKRKRISGNKVAGTSQAAISADTSAAIAMALYLHRFFREEKNREITIKKVTLPFSPWVTRGRNQVVTASNNMFSRRKS